MQNGENSNNIRTMLQEDQVEEVAQEQEIRRSTKSRTQSMTLTNYEMFHDQSLAGECDLIEDSKMTESKPINLNQTLKDENIQEDVKKEFKEIKKNQT